MVVPARPSSNCGYQLNAPYSPSVEEEGKGLAAMTKLLAPSVGQKFGGVKFKLGLGRSGRHPLLHGDVKINTKRQDLGHMMDGKGVDKGPKMTVDEYMKHAAEVKERIHHLLGDEPTYSTREQLLHRLVAEQSSQLGKLYYGSDIHVASSPSNPPSNSWDIRDLPWSPLSPSHRITENIPGFHQPFYYQGSPLTVSGMHTEDQYTCSANELVSGDRKDWYIAPESEAEKIEDIVKLELPALIGKNSCRLYDMNVFMNPFQLAAKGVKVFKICQEAGDIVITFPRAYHWVFNHGDNLALAINFALPMWLPFGRLAVENYRRCKKAWVFSQDQLVVNLVKKIPLGWDKDDVEFLVTDFTSMVDTECLLRGQFAGIGGRREDVETEQESHDCSACGAIPYLSYLKDSVSSTCYCLKCGIELVKNGRGKKRIKAEPLVVDQLVMRVGDESGSGRGRNESVKVCTLGCSGSCPLLSRGDE